MCSSLFPPVSFPAIRRFASLYGDFKKINRLGNRAFHLLIHSRRIGFTTYRNAERLESLNLLNSRGFLFDCFRDPFDFFIQFHFVSS
jgi:hypothetical protein